jgi:hypothetical protein
MTSRLPASYYTNADLSEEKDDDNAQAIQVEEDSEDDLTVDVGPPRSISSSETGLKETQRDIAEMNTNIKKIAEEVQSVMGVVQNLTAIMEDYLRKSNEVKASKYKEGRKRYKKQKSQKLGRS